MVFLSSRFFLVIILTFSRPCLLVLLCVHYSVSDRIPTHWVGTVSSPEGKEFTEAEKKSITQASAHTPHIRHTPHALLLTMTAAVKFLNCHANRSTAQISPLPFLTPSPLQPVLYFRTARLLVGEVCTKTGIRPPIVVFQDPDREAVLNTKIDRLLLFLDADRGDCAKNQNGPPIFVLRPRSLGTLNSTEKIHENKKSAARFCFRGPDRKGTLEYKKVDRPFTVFKTQTRRPYCYTKAKSTTLVCF